jgi:Spy/CpxP family protein refolding chaperone
MTYRSAKNLLQSFLSLLFFSVLINCDAQSEQKPENRPPLFPGGSTRYTPGYERLMSSLTDQQRASLRDIMAENRDKVRELEEKVREARKDMFVAGIMQKFDEKTVREKAFEAAKADAELTVLRVKALAEMKPPLSVDQLQRISAAAEGAQGGEAGRTGRRAKVKRDENDLPAKDK